MSASVAPYQTSDADLTAPKRSQKADDAYRTISEVADDLHVAQHVLRFWESKFKQIEPLKRAGGRRYYRPADVDLLKRIHYLLYNQGYTIKGVQKLLTKDKHLLQAVPNLQQPVGATAAGAGWIAPPVTQAYHVTSTASVVAATPTPAANEDETSENNDQLNLFSASDRMVMTDILRRLKNVQALLVA